MIPTAPQRFSFADLRWGIPKPEAKAQLIAKGYVFKKEDEDGDLLFSGKLVGYDAIIWELFPGDKLGKVAMSLISPDNKVRAVYADMKGNVDCEVRRAQKQIRVL